MAKPRIEVQIAAEVGNALNGLKRATEAINQFKAAAGAAGGRITVSLGNAAKRAGVAAREIKTEFSDSFAEVEAAIRASGVTAGNWSNTVSKDAQDASRAMATFASKATTSLDRTAKSLQRGVGKGIVHPSIQSDLLLLDKNLQRVSLTAKRTQGAMVGVGREGAAGIRGGTSAAISFGHIIQDLPYGINGVANNITQLTTQMGYMAASAKAAGVGMRTALIQSITNPATLAVLGISVLTSAMVFFTGKVGKAKKGVDDAKDSILSLNEAMQKGAADATGSLTQLDALYAASQDVARSTDERRKAVDTLQKKYPSYLGNISDEAILAGEASDAYKLLRTDIIRAAQARALQDQIIERTKEDLALQPKRLAALEKASDAQAKLNAFTEAYSGTSEAAKRADQGYQAQLALLTGNLTSAQTEFKELTEQSEEFREENKALADQLNNFSIGAITGDIGDTGDGDGGDGLKKFMDLQTEIAANAERLFQETLNARQKDLRRVKLYYDSLAAQATEGSAELGAIETQRREETARINAKYDAIELQQAEELRRKLEESRQELADNVAEINAQNRSDLMSEVERETHEINKEYDKRKKIIIAFYAEQIALATGNIIELMRLQGELTASLAANEQARSKMLASETGKRKETQSQAMRDMANLHEEWARTLSRELEGVLFEGENIFKAIGSAFKRMISQMIADALAADIAGALFKGKGGGIGGFLGGLFGGGGGGGLLKGLGSLLSFGNAGGPLFKMGGGLFPFANGGIVSGPTLGLVGEYPGAKSNPEVIAPLSDLTRMMDYSGGVNKVIVEGQISNDVIYLSNQRGAQNNKRFFGN